MWAPADLFTSTTNAVTLALKRLASYFSEHLLVLGIVIVVIATIIAWVGSRRTSRRDAED